MLDGRNLLVRLGFSGSSSVLTGRARRLISCVLFLFWRPPMRAAASRKTDLLQRQTVSRELGARFGDRLADARPPARTRRAFQRQRPVRAAASRGARRRLGGRRRRAAADGDHRSSGRARSSPATNRPTSRSTARSTPIAAASTAAPIATRARPTPISASRPGSTSSPSCSSRRTRRRCWRRSWRRRNTVRRRSRWAPTPTPTSRSSGNTASPARCWRFWRAAITPSASSPSPTS